MATRKEDFIRLLLDNGALKLENPEDPEGLFTLKSGRRSPFFMNLGELNTGTALLALGNAYAEAARQYFDDSIDVFFGPAYKGIPLAVITSIYYDMKTGRTTRYCSNRKEMKDHGDSGILLGTKVKDGDRVVIVEDVTTSGKSLAETIPILKAQADVDILGLIVSFDRMEYGQERTKTALEEAADKYNFEAHAIVNMVEVLNYISPCSESTLAKFKKYYSEYGPEKVG